MLSSGWESHALWYDVMGYYVLIFYSTTDRWICYERDYLASHKQWYWVRLWSNLIIQSQYLARYCFVIWLNAIQSNTISLSRGFDIPPRQIPKVSWQVLLRQHSGRSLCLLFLCGRSCVAAASKEYLALLHGDFSLGIILSDLWSTNSACSLGRIGFSDSMSRFGDEMMN